MTTAKFIDYPTTQLGLQGTATDSRSIWLLILSAVLATCVGALPSLLRRIPGLGRPEGSRTRTRADSVKVPS